MIECISTLRDLNYKSDNRGIAEQKFKPNTESLLLEELIALIHIWNLIDF